MNFKDYIASIPDFPQEGVLFRDITPLMADGKAFQEACDKVIDFARSVKADVIVGPESRGFIFGCPVAYELGIDVYKRQKQRHVCHQEGNEFQGYLLLIVLEGDEQADSVHGGCNEHPGCQCNGQRGLHAGSGQKQHT